MSVSIVEDPTRFVLVDLFFVIVSTQMLEERFYWFQIDGLEERKQT